MLQTAGHPRAEQSRDTMVIPSFPQWGQTTEGDDEDEDTSGLLTFHQLQHLLHRRRHPHKNRAAHNAVADVQFDEVRNFKERF